MVLFVAAGIVAALALASGRWLPEIPKLLGLAQANREAIGVLANVVQVLNVAVRGVLWGTVALLVYLGFKRLGTTEGGGTTAADVAPGGRSVAVGGDVDHSVVIAGDVTYDYSAVVSSSADPGKLEGAWRRLEDLPQEDVPERGALPQGSYMRLRSNPHFVGRHGNLKDITQTLKASFTGQSIAPPYSGGATWARASKGRTTRSGRGPPTERSWTSKNTPLAQKTQTSPRPSTISGRLSVRRTRRVPSSRSTSPHWRSSSSSCLSPQWTAST